MKSKLSDSYNKVRLEELASYVNNKVTIDKCKIDKYISTTNMKQNKGGIEKIDSLPKGKSVNSFKKNDILVSNIRPYFKKIWFAKFDGTCSTDILVFRCKENIYNKFLYYVLSNDYFFNYATKSSKGTKMPRGDKKAIMDYLVPTINIMEQRAIADTLSVLDDKIELNNKIIENLEKQIQAIFKHWFVDFEFPDENGNPYKSSGGEMIDSELGMIPKGWKVNEILEMINFSGGSQPPKKEHIYEKKPGYVRFIQNRDYSDNKSHLTYIKESKKNRICNKYDILIDKYGEAGKTRFGISGAYNVALGKIEPKNPTNREFIRRFLEQSNIEQYLYNSSIASTRPSLNRTTFTGLKLVIPNSKIKKQFNDFSLNVIDIILKNKAQNQTLETLRDTLIPKLMSGEIRIPLN